MQKPLGGKGLKDFATKFTTVGKNSKTRGVYKTIHKIPITQDLLTTFPKLTTMTSPFRASNSALRD